MFGKKKQEVKSKRMTVYQVWFERGDHATWEYMDINPMAQDIWDSRDYIVSGKTYRGVIRNGEPYLKEGEKVYFPIMNTTAVYEKERDVIEEE
jgi:hypothetical protein